MLLGDRGGGEGEREGCLFVIGKGGEGGREHCCQIAENSNILLKSSGGN